MGAYSKCGFHSVLANFVHFIALASPHSGAELTLKNEGREFTGRNLGKTNPLNDNDLADFVRLQKNFADSPKSWTADAKTIDKETFDLSVKNPNGGEEEKHRTPQEIMDEIAALDLKSAEVLGRIKALL